jgi:hypothetical protein
VVTISGERENPGIPDPAELDAILERLARLDPALNARQEHVSLNGRQIAARDARGINHPVVCGNIERIFFYGRSLEKILDQGGFIKGHQVSRDSHVLHPYVIGRLEDVLLRVKTSGVDEFKKISRGSPCTGMDAAGGDRKSVV